jgi:hypothetical protein
MISTASRSRWQQQIGQFAEKRGGGCRARRKTAMKSPGAISNSRKVARQGEAQGCAEYEIAGSDFKQPQAGP